MKSSELSLLVAAAVLLCGLAAQSVPARDPRPRSVSFQALQQPPTDSAEAGRLRIWLGIERTSNCRVTVTIADSSGRVVRHLFSRLMGNGFYNIYWDKKDDSGRWAPAGYYVVHIDDCGEEKSAEIEAVYRPFEDLTKLAVVAADPKAEIDLSLQADSASVTLKVHTLTGQEMATIVRDTMIYRGEHQLPLDVDNQLGQGRYMLRLYINEGFVCETEFTYIP